ncbi:MAG: ATP-dependent DNA helicase, partial [Alphaproteobacteria bacterium]|nr:ATP-dependent DNA helicase [Alphaproteobacteria bacterium]
PGLLEAAHALRLRLGDLRRPMVSLIKKLRDKLADDADKLDSDARERIHYTVNSLSFRADALVGGWIDMLDSLKATPPAECVDWLEITRIDGHDNDAGFYRCYIDPAQVFAERLKPHAQGIAVTAATLRDVSEGDPKGWTCALTRTGVKHLSDVPKLFHVSSPFDYKNQTRVLIVNDVKKGNVDEVAAAFRELFLASGGGALGIFTAVQRLKMVREKLLLPMEENGISLYAQHVDQLDASTLIDIFREEENSCLLGTDATRDGIDVPGRSLRLVVYDRVPWPRPTLLHKARRASFGKNYNDMLTRFKLKQAYGRLIRRFDDKGIFVMLDSGLPSRISTAFPEGVEVKRIGIAEAVSLTKEFLRF